jgi:HTH-type transcriptional regulator, sugar sensing transcriptional regulator
LGIVIDQLVKLGLKEYEARVFTALVSLGVAGVTEISLSSGVPRTKMYEILDALVKRGFVEARPGRPLMYKPVRARMVIEQLVEGYNMTAKEAIRTLEEKEENEGSKTSIQSDYAWIIKGNQSIKQKIAELLSNADNEIFALEMHPPRWLCSVKTMLKAAAARGVKIDAVCVVKPTDAFDDRLNDPLIEYRLVKDESVSKGEGDHLEKSIMLSIRKGLQAGTTIIVVDRNATFNIIKNQNDKETVGALIKIPGAPAAQRLTIGKMLSIYTMRLS